MKYRYDAYTDIGGRKENEDSYAVKVYGNSIVAVVADGLGGQGDGKAASRSITGSLVQCGQSGDFPSAEQIERAFLYANTALMREQQNSFHMKTTAVYLCIQGNRAIWAHVGDSRLYHIYHGQVCDYTLDHSVAQLAVLLGKIRREDIPADPGQSKLLRVMGTEDTMPDLHEEITLGKGRHGFLLCTDGLWEYLQDAEIEDTFSESTSATRWLDQLKERKESRSPENCDNHTAIAFMLDV